MRGSVSRWRIASTVCHASTACDRSSPRKAPRGTSSSALPERPSIIWRSVRPVVVEGSQSGIGAVSGGVVGGIAGSSVGGSRESAAIGVIGAVAGGVIGNAMERAGTREAAVELLVQLRNGERRAIVQAQGKDQFLPGDAVILVTTGGKTRVTRAPAVVPAPAVVTPG